MKQITFTTIINAPAEKVWFCLWNKCNYENWTKVFSEGSTAVSDWKKGSRIHFLSPECSGMFSDIIEMIPNVQMSFNHLGEVKNAEEQEVNDEWKDSEESYYLSEENGVTTLKTILKIDEKWEDFFNDTFPKALELVKEDAENGTVQLITVQTLIDKPLQEVWEKYTKPEHIINWNFASDDWHCPKAYNEPKTGGQFFYRMESKDGSMGFDFEGTFTEVIPLKKLSFNLGERKVWTEFIEFNGKILVTGNFEPENVHSIFMQRDGWQAILNNFKKYCE
ncbi:SRPBCC domain-containing protein [Flavobacterium okayamense]|uniref:Activator of Hsp90 ATPase homologue 1/2-like C-terminal domain-containing protein n=1 Tax=Flavobacterium okayamense TaxID=2830782 RepID=A0ABM7S5R7_9FLAO|nr:SRPBCC domain-containing protein [Flavobacterium okayamense]BCY28885.1 hypothetical protein KK2020170_17530 [Flavobacterium okayamense]